MKIEEYVPLATLTTLRVGGPARYVVTVEHESECVEAVLFAERVGLPLIPLGGGSNMLAPDSGVQAVFVRVALQGITVSLEGDAAHVTAEAGTKWDSVVHYAVENGWWGMENLSSIPGTVGGAVVQNIGAYGAVLGNILEFVETFDCVQKSFRRMSAVECCSGYRNTLFKMESDRYLVLRATFVLSKKPQPNLAYKDLAHWFQNAPTARLEDIRHAVSTVRAQKFPSLLEFGTAGSFFLNPIMSAENAQRVQTEYPSMPVFPMPEGGVKVPLAWFLEHVVNVKGKREGLAHVWHAHSLVLATDAGASAADVHTLAEKISKEVFDELGIKIFPEVRLL